MKRFFSMIMLVACMSLLAGGSSAMAAGEVLDFGFTNLNGSFNSSSSLFTASDDANTSGSVSRLVPLVGDAFFQGTAVDAGFPNMAAFDLSLTLSSITTSTAAATGVITFTDTNGDVLTGNVSGDWNELSGTTVAGIFSGVITNFIPVDNSGDNTFDGNSGPGFSTIFNSMLPFDGAIVTLEFGNWFTDGGGVPTDFFNSATQATGIVVPEPATLAMLGLGGLALIVRRRKK